MERCFQLAQQAADLGESAVGSIIVRDGKIIGEGIEKSRQQKDITRHAEMVAILDALHSGAGLSGATIYSNVEPCILCSYAIRHFKIAHVVFARPAGELGGTNPPCNVLTATHFKSWGPPPVVTIYPLG